MWYKNAILLYRFEHRIFTSQGIWKRAKAAAFMTQQTRICFKYALFMYGRRFDGESAIRVRISSGVPTIAGARPYLMQMVLYTKYQPGYKPFRWIVMQMYFSPVDVIRKHNDLCHPTFKGFLSPDYIFGVCPLFAPNNFYFLYFSQLCFGSLGVITFGYIYFSWILRSWTSA